MTVSVAGTRGYILEEALVALTRNAGYYPAHGHHRTDEL